MLVEVDLGVGGRQVADYSDRCSAIRNTLLWFLVRSRCSSWWNMGSRVDRYFTIGLSKFPNIQYLGNLAMIHVGSPIAVQHAFTSAVWLMHGHPGRFLPIVLLVWRLKEHQKSEMWRREPFCGEYVDLPNASETWCLGGGFKTTMRVLGPYKGMRMPLSR